MVILHLLVVVLTLCRLVLPSLHLYRHYMVIWFLLQLFCVSHVIVHRFGGFVSLRFCFSHLLVILTLGNLLLHLYNHSTSLHASLLLSFCLCGHFKSLQLLLCGRFAYFVWLLVVCVCVIVLYLFILMVIMHVSLWRSSCVSLWLFDISFVSLWFVSLWFVSLWFVSLWCVSPGDHLLVVVLHPCDFILHPYGVFSVSLWLFCIS